MQLANENDDDDSTQLTIWSTTMTRVSTKQSNQDVLYCDLSQCVSTQLASGTYTTVSGVLTSWLFMITMGITVLVYQPS